MSPAEEQNFRERLTSDTELAKMTGEIKLLSIGIQEVSLQKKLSQFHQPTTSRKVISINKWLIAASVLFAVLIGTYFFTRTKNTLYTAYFQPDPGLITPMSSTSDYSFYHAMTDYKSGNYSAAIKTWEGLLSERPSSDTLNYFLGAAYLADNKTGKAVSSFEKVIADSTSYFIKDAYWYLGLAQLKLGNKKEAIGYLEKSEHASKEKLLQELKDN